MSQTAKNYTAWVKSGKIITYSSDTVHGMEKREVFVINEHEKETKKMFCYHRRKANQDKVHSLCS